jgi:predicted acyl esterase
MEETVMAKRAAWQPTLLAWRSGALVTLLGVLILAGSGYVRSQQTPDAPSKQTLLLPMRDGVKLATDIYLPAGAGPFPVILIRLPYNKNGLAGMGADGAKRGYAIVAQDTRGRFASEGENLPFIGDYWGKYADGQETVEWIAKQSWCNGKIGTFGGSALGITQLGLAGTGTDKLSAQLIQVATPRFYHDAVFPGGVFKKAMLEDWLKATQHSPESLKYFIDHPTYDAFWRGQDLTTRWSKVNAPAMHVGGWYDIFAQGTIDAFLGYQTKGGPKARGKQKLLIGPWAHGIFQEKVGAFTFPNAKTPPNSLADPWRWFDYHLKGAENGMSGVPAVTYYVMGDTTDKSAPGNEWRTAETWPPVPATPTPYYLRADKTLTLTKPAENEAALTYAYDPKNPAPTIGGPQLTLPAGPLDQRALESRPDALVFTSEPLAAPLEVTGRVTVRLYAASDAPDTDFFVKLCDVYPDGRSFNVCEGQLRARFREGFTQEKRLEPGKVVALPIDLWSTSIIFNKGHRLRVIVTSSSAPGYDPNPNTGASFRADDRTRIARNTLALSARHPSHILLPVVRPQGQAAKR